MKSNEKMRKSCHHFELPNPVFVVNTVYSSVAIAVSHGKIVNSLSILGREFVMTRISVLQEIKEPFYPSILHSFITGS